MKKTAQPGASDRLLAVGGIAGAVLASSCCVLPLVLVTVGIGGAWVSHLTALAPYQPYVLGATVPLLGIGLWHVYLRPAPPCEPGTLCAVPSSRRFTKSDAVVGTAALWTNHADRSAEPTVVPAAANLRTAVFRVDQMTCATCPITVKAAMSAVTGVASVEVDFDTKAATVRFDPAIAAPAQIAEASTNAGYPAAPVS